MIVGIDPGLEGALAFLSDSVRVVDMPLRPHIRRERVDGRQILNLLMETEPDLVVMEAVHGRPGNGAAASFTFGLGFGVLLGIIDAMGVPLVLVTPQKWKSDVLHGTKKDKAAAVAWAQSRFPDLGRLRHDQAEALCLAHWGKTQV